MEGSVFRKMVHDKPADGGDPKFNQASFDEIWPCAGGTQRRLQRHESPRRHSNRRPEENVGTS